MRPSPHLPIVALLGSDAGAVVADRYERIGRDDFTPADHTHTTQAVTELNAECVAQGLTALPDLPDSSVVIAARAVPD